MVETLQLGGQHCFIIFKPNIMINHNIRKKIPGKTHLIFIKSYEKNCQTNLYKILILRVFFSKIQWL